MEAASNPAPGATKTNDPAGGVATLAPPPEIDGVQVANVIARNDNPVSDGPTATAGEHVNYWVDPDTGRCTRAELLMWRGETSYTAHVTYDGSGYVWSELTPGGEWQPVKRGQHTLRVQPIIEQAREYATNRVFGAWPG